MNKKDTEDRATRLAYRNALISALFFELYEPYKYWDPFIERDDPPSLRDTDIPGERDAG